MLGQRLLESLLCAALALSSPTDLAWRQAMDSQIIEAYIAFQNVNSSLSFFLNQTKKRGGEMTGLGSVSALG